MYRFLTCNFVCLICQKYVIVCYNFWEKGQSVVNTFESFNQKIFRIFDSKNTEVSNRFAKESCICFLLIYESTYLKLFKVPLSKLGWGHLFCNVLASHKCLLSKTIWYKTRVKSRVQFLSKGSLSDWINWLCPFLISPVAWYLNHFLLMVEWKCVRASFYIQEKNICWK